MLIRSTRPKQIIDQPPNTVTGIDVGNHRPVIASAAPAPQHQPLPHQPRPQRPSAHRLRPRSQPPQPLPLRWLYEPTDSSCSQPEPARYAPRSTRPTPPDAATPPTDHDAHQSTPEPSPPTTLPYSNPTPQPPWSPRRTRPQTTAHSAASIEPAYCADDAPHQRPLVSSSRRFSLPPSLVPDRSIGIGIAATAGAQFPYRFSSKAPAGATSHPQGARDKGTLSITCSRSRSRSR